MKIEDYLKEVILKEVVGEEKEKIRKGFAARFKQLVEEILPKERNIAKSDLIKKLNVKETTFNNYTSGKSELPLILLYKLHFYFDVNLNWLISGKGSHFTGVSYGGQKNYNLSKKVQEISKILGLSRQQFIKLSPIESELELSLIEEGRRELEEERALKMAETFCVNPDWLIYDKAENPFNSRRECFHLHTDLAFYGFPLLKPYKLFISTCSNDEETLHFALWCIQKELGPYSGIVYCDPVNYAVWHWNDKYDTVCGFKKFLVNLAEVGVFVEVVNNEEFRELITGKIHPARVKGRPLPFPLFWYLTDYNYQIELTTFRGTPFYCLVRLLVDFLLRC